jgi:hypothetical protein
METAREERAKGRERIRPFFLPLSLYPQKTVSMVCLNRDRAENQRNEKERGGERERGGDGREEKICPFPLYL